MGKARLRLRIFDGTREPFSKPVKVLVKIVDGMQKQLVWDFYSSSDILFKDLPFYDNFGDNYTVLVSADGYKDAGFYPVKLSDTYTQTLNVMLVSKTSGFSFAKARWGTVKAAFPFLAADVDDATGKSRYGDLVEAEQPLACLLNLVEAAGKIALSQGTPLSYVKQLRWDGDFAPKQDRVFAWCDAALIDQVRIGESVKLFSEEPAPGILHPGATHSWKEIQYSEADLQLTFHENDKQTIAGTKCVTLELDIDYYRDPLAHVFLEVFPNGLTHTLTNPIEVYVLRWMAGQMAKTPEFAPLYVVTD
jgi:hypothetical protein